MTGVNAWHADTLGARVVVALERNNFFATYTQTRQECVDQILTLIGDGASVGIGDPGFCWRI